MYRFIAMCLGLVVVGVMGKLFPNQMPANTAIWVCAFILAVTTISFWAIPSTQKVKMEATSQPTFHHYLLEMEAFKMPNMTVHFQDGTSQTGTIIEVYGDPADGMFGMEWESNNPQQGDFTTCYYWIHDIRRLEMPKKYRRHKDRVT